VPVSGLLGDFFGGETVMTWPERFLRAALMALVLAGLWMVAELVL